MILTAYLTAEECNFIMALHMNFLGSVQNNTTTFSMLHNKTPGVHLLPETTKSRITEARERNWESMLEEESLVLLEPLISLATIKS